MNGRYSLAQTPEERIAIATVAAIHAYFLENPQGVAPGQGFLMNFLKPFVERELLEARLDELHQRHSLAISAREREILEQLSIIRGECGNRVKAAGTS